MKWQCDVRLTSFMPWKKSLLPEPFEGGSARGVMYVLSVFPKLRAAARAKNLSRSHGELVVEI